MHLWVVLPRNYAAAPILTNVLVLSHDYCQGENKHGKLFDTHIGNNCVIGVNSIIMGGVNVGNHCIIGAGSIVVKDIPANSMAVGNPAHVIKRGILISDDGQLLKYGEPIMQ